MYIILMASWMIWIKVQLPIQDWKMSMFSLEVPKDMRSFHTWVLQLVYVYMLYIYNLIIMVDTDIK